jgi:kinesin family member C1
MTTPKKLSELSAAANNARPTSMLPPPQVGMKRKTLAERAAELPRAAPAPPGSRIAGPATKATVLANVAHHGYASSTSSRPASVASSRTTSTTTSHHNSRFQPSTHRPQTAMSHHAKSRSVHGHSRPISTIDGAMGTTRNGQVDAPANSMPFVSLRKCSANTSRRKMPRFTPPRVSSDEPSDQGDIGSSTLNERTVQSLRNVSLVSAMRSLSIEPEFRASSASPAKGIATTPTPVFPKTKSSAAFSPTRSTRSPRKTPSKDKLFLNKYSNAKMPDWDLGSRVENMESMYADLKTSLSTTTAESNSLKESITLYKARGKSENGGGTSN